MDNQAAIRAHEKGLRRGYWRKATIDHRIANVGRLAAALPVDLLAADEEMLFTWQDDLRARGLRVSSLHTYTSHTRRFYTWAYEIGLIEENPARNLRSPRVPLGRAKPITEDDLRLAIRCAPDLVRTWLVLAAYLGLRAGEIARICREDVGEDVLDIPDGKGGRSRTVPLPAVVRETLLGYLRSDAGRIFLTEWGTPMRPSYVSRKCNALLHGVAGPEITLHKLRHRFGTETYRLSKDPRLVQDLLGHQSLATTQLYLAVSAEQGRGVTDKLAEGLRSADRPHRPAKARRPRATTSRDTPRAGWATPLRDTA